MDGPGAATLGLAWYADLKVDRGVEASPLEIGGVLYNIEPWNVTVAYDAVTGKELWRFDPKVDRDKGRLACCDIVTRGLAAWQGKILIATLDGRLIALDAKTGKPRWSVNTLDPVWPYTITGAPRVFDGKVLIGNAGAEGAARGYVTAYDVNTGKQLWRFYTVPGDPAKPLPARAGPARPEAQVEVDEAALFTLAIDDVERIDDRFHPGIGAPQRKGQAEKECGAQRSLAVAEHAGDLVLHDLERAVRQHVGKGPEVADPATIADNLRALDYMQPHG
eukprot:gene6770-biopygen5747